VLALDTLITHEKKKKGLLPNSEVIHNTGIYESSVTRTTATQGPVDKSIACTSDIVQLPWTSFAA
jgi:hypothetical protein